MRKALSFAVAYLAITVSTPFAQGALHVVDPELGSGSTHATIAQALATAQDGDIVLLRNGFYAEDIEVASLAVTIQVEPGAWAIVRKLAVTDLGANQDVRVRGVVIEARRGSARAIEIHDCAGSVWLEDVIVLPTQSTSELVSIRNNTSVVLTRVAIEDRSTLGPALRLVDSSTYVFDSEIDALQGPGAINVVGGVLGLYETTARGVVALRLVSGNPTVYLQDEDFTRLGRRQRIDPVARVPRAHAPRDLARVRRRRPVGRRARRAGRPGLGLLRSRATAGPDQLGL